MGQVGMLYLKPTFGDVAPQAAFPPLLAEAAELGFENDDIRVLKTFMQLPLEPYLTRLLNMALDEKKFDIAVNATER
jgi:hypothetical protein